MKSNLNDEPRAQQPVGSSDLLGGLELTPDEIGELLTRQELAVLDADLRAPWEGMPWQRVHSDKLVQVQLCRLVRELISITKEGNERRKS